MVLWKDMHSAMDENFGVRTGTYNHGGPIPLPHKGRGNEADSQTFARGKEHISNMHSYVPISHIFITYILLHQQISRFLMLPSSSSSTSFLSPHINHPQSAHVTVFVLWNSSNPALPLKRPNPLALAPPWGRLGSSWTDMLLMWTALMWVVSL